MTIRAEGLRSAVAKLVLASGQLVDENIALRAEVARLREALWAICHGTNVIDVSIARHALAPVEEDIGD